MFKLINKTETGENYMININEVLMQNKIAKELVLLYTIYLDVHSLELNFN